LTSCAKAALAGEHRLGFAQHARQSPPAALFRRLSDLSFVLGELVLGALLAFLVGPEPVQPGAP
jgi:hypothetical protein